MGERPIIWYVFLGLAVLMSLFGIANLFTDYLWFSGLGFGNVFMVTLESNLLLFFAGGLIFFLFLMLNLWISHALRGKQKSFVSFRFKLLLSLVMSYFVARSMALGYDTFLKYINQVPFGLIDPVFMKDVSFYVFTLPFYFLVWRFMMALVIITTIAVLLDYFQAMLATLLRYPREGEDPTAWRMNFKSEILKLKNKAILHIGLLVGAFFVLLAFRHYLYQFQVMFRAKSLIVGASYADVFVTLPIIKSLIILTLCLALMSISWVLFIRKTHIRMGRIFGYVFMLYIAVALFGLSFIPAIVQNFRVAPNEQNLEAPFIENNIKYTKLAYGLDEVEEREYEASQTLSAGEVFGAKGTVENIRILDWKPLTATYKQTQEIRLYYDLAEIDIDRYMIDGKYRQVLLSTRELDQRQLPEGAKTWVNLHQIYTHGYGVVMSPVNEVTDQGLPNYFIKDIPPIYTVAEPSIRIERPEIYFGEAANEYVIVNTGTKELDYPKGDSNEYVSYEGKGGIALDSFGKKVLMALRFGDVKILLSSDINLQSRIMIYRNIQERVERITPFIFLDSDPYMVIDNGKLLWIQDGYTLSGNFPYSAKTAKINYIRNSVKVVIDAYDGTMTYYVPENEPIIDTYSRIYPGLFHDISEMPESLSKHVRYPEDLFRIQSDIFQTYHMNNANVFYNKEDSWQTPLEIYGTGQQIEVEPYYIIMRFPDSVIEEFVLMTSYTPVNKDNMVSWLAARSDGDNYGKLLLYKFPKDKLVYGPSQIEARIDQDSAISEQLTLWSQQGSRVTRGNLLVIPINQSLLYIEPLYLESEQGQLPELKRVIVSDGNTVVMRENLNDALVALFGEERPTNEVTLTNDELIKEANSLYQKVLQAMASNDWSGMGLHFSSLGEALDKLEGTLE